MPNPGFYDLAWRDEDPARAALQLVVGELRRRGQHVSPADLIGVESTARGLALIRGHARVWRGTCWTGSSALWSRTSWSSACPIRCSTPPTPCCAGGARGKLADGVSRPPFVRDLEAALERCELVPAPAARTVDLRLEEELERSRLLHRIVVLGLPGFELIDVARRPRSAGACASTATSTGRRWRPPATGRRSARRPRRGCWSGSRGWSGTRGPPRRCWPTRRCAAWWRSPGRCSRACATLVGSATRPGFGGRGAALGPAPLPLRGRARHRGRSGVPGAARGRLRPRPVAARAGRAPEDAGVEAVRAAVETFERCARRPRGAHRRARTAAGRRGRRARAARCRARRAVGARRRERRRAASPARCSSPTRSCSATSCSACSPWRASPCSGGRDLVARIDEVVMAFADEEFLDALPALRRAFSAFTPREKDRLARGLPGGARLDQAAAADPRRWRRCSSWRRGCAARWSGTGCGRERGAAGAVAARARQRRRRRAGRRRAGRCGDRARSRARVPLRPRAGRRAQRPARNARRLGADRAGLDQRRPRAVPAAGRRAAREATRWSATGCSRSSPIREVLQRATPNLTLLKAVLSTKHLMSAEVLAEARRIIRAVVDELLKQLAREVALAVHRRAGPATADRGTGSRPTSTRRPRSGATCGTSTRRPAG